MYDMTNVESFEALEKWREEFLRRVGTDDSNTFPFIILGNKCDQERKVSKERARAWALEIGAEFFETSARDKTCVEEAFMKSIDLIMRKRESNQESTQSETDKPSLKLKKVKDNETESCC